MRKLGMILVVVLMVISPLAVFPTFAAAAVSCPDSMPTRLTVGGRGQIAMTFSTLWDAPAGNFVQVVDAPATFTVLAGPTSANDLCYFQIRYDNGVTGWADESEVSSTYGSNLYWLAPSTSPAPPAIVSGGACPGSLAPNLTVGGRGKIAYTFSTLWSAVGGSFVQVVNAPASFTVLAGPSSDGTLCYFQIKYDSGATGWAADSEITSIYGSNLYWLVPDNAG